MLAIQDLVEKARHASEEVQKGVIRAGLKRHLYSFEPRQKQIDAIWDLVFKEEDLLLAAKTSFGKNVVFQAAPVVPSRRYRPHHDPPRSNRTGAVRQDRWRV
ncbi:hypothetical protein E5D57_008114 [Metarhizium anisopliae]|nr:hypothetical protein E5D57_008114 [Metarhizium anisopliae]